MYKEIFSAIAITLAYPVKLKSEVDLAEIWPEPLDVVVFVLEKY